MKASSHSFLCYLTNRTLVIDVLTSFGKLAQIVWNVRKREDLVLFCVVNGLKTVLFVCAQIWSNDYTYSERGRVLSGDYVL